LRPHGLLPTDPEVFVYGERVNLPPIVLSIQWLPLDETWKSGWYMVQQQDAALFWDIKERINALSCVQLQLRK
jgi:hypothetical protein